MNDATATETAPWYFDDSRIEYAAPLAAHLRACYTARPTQREVTHKTFGIAGFLTQEAVEYPLGTIVRVEFPSRPDLDGAYLTDFIGLPNLSARQPIAYDGCDPTAQPSQNGVSRSGDFVRSGEQEQS